MNDHMELHWGYRVWEAAASTKLSSLGRDFLDRIDSHIHSSGAFGLVTCSSFSLKADLLSQWRGYAADGQGYAIGFRATALAELPGMLLKVSYDEKEQLREVSGYIDLLHKAETYDAANGTRHFPEFSFLLAVLLAGYKNPGFSEEAEVRLVHLLDFEQSNGGLKLVDVPDDSRPDSAPPLPISFRMRDHTPVAYVDIPFRADGSPNPITEVILGPRNHSLPSGINVFLETIGLPGVTIRTSRASYRG